MDYKALIDFNKFTLALAAVGLVCVLERFVQADSAILFAAILIILILFLVSALAGIFLFAAATFGLHSERKDGDENKVRRLDTLIKPLGITLIICFGLGMAILGVVIVTQVVFAKNEMHSTPECCEYRQH